MIKKYDKDPSINKSKQPMFELNLDKSLGNPSPISTSPLASNRKSVFDKNKHGPH